MGFVEGLVIGWIVGTICMGIYSIFTLNRFCDDVMKIMKGKKE